jgi:hypothetical protein
MQLRCDRPPELESEVRQRDVRGGPGRAGLEQPFRGACPSRFVDKEGYENH